MPNRSARPFKRFRRWLLTAPVIETLLVWFVAIPVWVISLLPKRLAWFIGRNGGRVAALIERRKMKLTLENLARAFPEKSTKELRVIRSKCYQHLGLNFIDFCRQSRLTKENLSETVVPQEGMLEKTKAELELGKGLIAVGSHFGNWELSGCAMNLFGFPTLSIARKLDSPRLDAYITARRELSGQKIHHKEGALLACLRALKNGRVLGLITDQHSRDNAVPVPFFGEDAMTVDTAAHIVLKTGCGLICYFVVRQEDGSYVYKASDPLRERFTPTGDKEKDVYSILLFCTQQLEKTIREHPEQWLSIYRRWRKRPAMAEEVSDGTE